MNKSLSRCFSWAGSALSSFGALPKPLWGVPTLQHIRLSCRRRCRACWVTLGCCHDVSECLSRFLRCAGSNRHRDLWRLVHRPWRRPPGSQSEETVLSDRWEHICSRFSSSTHESHSWSFPKLGSWTFSTLKKQSGPFRCRSRCGR